MANTDNPTATAAARIGVGIYCTQVTAIIAVVKCPPDSGHG
ncbi:MAG: hypothetical protein R3341_04830 [Methylophaga sp.]|nr:hypothetical protein [Methylophaga sp.]